VGYTRQGLLVSQRWCQWQPGHPVMPQVSLDRHRLSMRWTLRLLPCELQGWVSNQSVCGGVVVRNRIPHPHPHPHPHLHRQQLPHGGMDRLQRSYHSIDPAVQRFDQRAPPSSFESAKDDLAMRSEVRVQRNLKKQGHANSTRLDHPNNPNTVFPSGGEQVLRATRI
jgi:hypothetical protein